MIFALIGHFARGAAYVGGVAAAVAALASVGWVGWRLLRIGDDIAKDRRPKGKP